MIKIVFIFLSFLFQIWGDDGLGKSIFLDNGIVSEAVIDHCLATNKADIMLLIETSQYVDSISFNIIKKFGTKMVERLNISDGGNHLGLVVFSDKASLLLKLSQHGDIIKHKIESLTNTDIMKEPAVGRALKFSKDIFLSTNTRPKIPKLLFVITSGTSTDDIIPHSEQLQKDNYLVYAIGLSKQIDINHLVAISGNKNRTFYLTQQTEPDQRLVDSLTWSACKSDYRPPQPELICGKKGIGIRGGTQKDFDGHIFVLDHFNEGECKKSAVDFDDPRSISLSVPFHSCGVKRWRSLEPRGMHVEVTVVIMFHHTFMTGIDQVMKLKCFYHEGTKSLQSNIKVDDIEFVGFTQGKYSIPSCTYHLRRENPNGEIVSVGSVGDKVWHRWECKEEGDSQVYGMLVHDCFVQNNKGEMITILDKNGCTVDETLLDTPVYDKDMQIALTKSEIFKFADKNALQFQCKITLCHRKDNGCDTFSPPKCNQVANLTRIKRKSLESFDVISDPIEVMSKKWTPSSCEVPQFGNNLIGPLIASNLFFVAALLMLFIYFTQRKKPIRMASRIFLVSPASN
uniref:ZP domain-containing protein n=1 Tax=Rhabditophanes sp. KR3021 TaxID=114890 RepID=A0AC35U0R5_9BILA